MTTKGTRRVADLQREYYARTARTYDEMHGGDREHEVALRYISGFIRASGAESALDVGAGTGRGIGYLRRIHPELTVRGVEPSAELIEQSVSGHGVSSGTILRGSGESLPFADDTFDVVFELAVLHHVARPADVISELIRVGRRAIFLSDENRFGHGPMPARALKLALYKAHAWGPVDALKTRGRGYRVSADDGISYSYSVYDSYRALADWATRVVLIPTREVESRTLLTPLVTSSQVLLCALRD